MHALVLLSLVCGIPAGGASAAPGARVRAPACLEVAPRPSAYRAAELTERLEPSTDNPRTPRAAFELKPFFTYHSDLVQHDLLLFLPQAEGAVPWSSLGGPLPQSGLDPQRALLRQQPVSEELRTTPRDRDRLELFRPVEAQGKWIAVGTLMFGVATVMSAHAPRPLRFLFDKSVHLGPAIFDTGGMGAGIGGEAF